MGRPRWSPANEAPWLLAASQASASQTRARLEGPRPPGPALTSAVILAMSPAEMAPLSTFRLRPGFLGSLRLLMRLRTRFRYFMSVLLSSW